MTAHERIRCGRCGTEVDWVPFCPNCDAYLGFFGTPRWSAKPDDQPVPPSGDVDSPFRPPADAGPQALPDPAMESKPQPIAGTVVEPDCEISAEPVAEGGSEPVVQEASWPDAHPAMQPVTWPDPEEGSGPADGPSAQVAPAVEIAQASPVQPVKQQLPPGYKPWHWWTPWRRRYRPAVTTTEPLPQSEPVHEDIGLAVLGDPEPIRPQARRPAPPVVRRRTTVTAQPEMPFPPDTALVCPECNGLNPPHRTYCQFCASVLDPQMMVADQPTNHLLFSGGAGESVITVVGSRPAGRTIGEKIGNGIGAFTDWLKELPNRIKKLIKKAEANAKTTMLVGGAFLVSVVTLLTLIGPVADPMKSMIGHTVSKVREFVDPTAGDSVLVQSVTASSTMEGTSAVSLIDGDTRTFWASAPDRHTDGVGTRLDLVLSGPQTFDRIRISPGIQNGKLDPNALATPRQLTIHAPGQPKVVVQLIEVNRSGGDDQVIAFAPITAGQVSVEIDSVYPSPSAGSPSVAITILGFIQQA